MNLYIWENVSGLTDREHDGGGVAIVAESVEHARQQLAERPDVTTPEEAAKRTAYYAKHAKKNQSHCVIEPSEVFTQEPDATYELASSVTPDGKHSWSYEPKVWIFKNAGCC